MPKQAMYGLIAIHLLLRHETAVWIVVLVQRGTEHARTGVNRTVSRTRSRTQRQHHLASRWRDSRQPWHSSAHSSLRWWPRGDHRVAE
jgi:hypothetical protein